MGEVTEFGTSGLLYRSNKLMYDRSTETLWSHFTGKPVVGPLVDSGIKLEVLPVTVTTWEEWRSKHPDTTVLNIYTGIYSPESYFPEKHPGAIYADYRGGAGCYLPCLGPERGLAAEVTGGGRLVQRRVEGLSPE